MNFGKINKVCLIGGGEPMVHCARYMKKNRIDVHAILAPRHESSELPLSGKLLSVTLKEAGIPYVCVEDINAASFTSGHLKKENFDMAICFGPAWVFNEAVRAVFKDKMVNFNGIPIPRYLGGAHYTWQILNGDKTSGMAIQHITAQVDLGDVLKYEEKKLPESARIPQDYFRENYGFADKFLERFVDELMLQKDFPATPYESLQSNRLYFPRLLTLQQAYINWSWDGADIEKFCCAFDRPYPGSSTFIKGQRVFVKSVTLDTTEAPTHPFCSGLVIRKYKGVLTIAVTGGALKVKEILDANGNDFMAKIREGDRLHTPNEKLEYAQLYRPQISSKRAA